VSTKFLLILHLFYSPTPSFHVTWIIPVSQHRKVNGRSSTLASASRKGKWTGQLPEQIVEDCPKLLIFFPQCAINVRIECGHKCKPRPYLLIKQSLSTRKNAANCTQNTSISWILLYSKADLQPARGSQCELHTQQNCTLKTEGKQILLQYKIRLLGKWIVCATVKCSEYFGHASPHQIKMHLLWFSSARQH